MNIRCNVELGRGLLATVTLRPPLGQRGTITISFYDDNTFTTGYAGVAQTMQTMYKAWPFTTVLGVNLWTSFIRLTSTDARAGSNSFVAGGGSGAGHYMEDVDGTKGEIYIYNATLTDDVYYTAIFTPVYK